MGGLALLGGTVLTANPRFSVARAVGIRAGKIAAIGTEHHVLDVLGPGAERVNLDGATVIPGLYDTHIHVTKLALQEEQVHIDGSRSLQQALAGVRVAVRTREPGQWVTVFTEDNVWRMADWDKPRPPTLVELDEAAPLNPLLFPLDQGGAVLNSAAVAAARARQTIVQTDVSPEGFVTSEPVLAALMGLAAEGPATRLPQLLRRMCRRLNALGITSVLDAGRVGTFVQDQAAYSEIETAGELTLRVTLADRVDPSWSTEELEHSLATLAGYRPKPGSLIRTGPMKLILDGEIIDALQRDDYPHHSGYRGRQRLSHDYLAKVLALAAARNLSTCIHTMGGAATDLALSSYEQAFGHASRATRSPGLSLAHAFFPSPKNLEACRRLGVWLAVQPPLLYCFGDECAKAWGRPATEEASPLRTILNCGIPMAGGTDVWPPSPFFGMWQAVTRRTVSGDVMGANQAITRKEALGLYTIWGADAMGDADTRGGLRPGEDADLVVLEENPLTCEEGRLRRPRVLLTLLGGRAVHAEGEWGLLCPG